MVLNLHHLPGVDHIPGIKGMRLPAPLQLAGLEPALAKIAHGCAVAQNMLADYQPLLKDVLTQRASNFLDMVGDLTDEDAEPTVPLWHCQYSCRVAIYKKNVGAYQYLVAH